MSEVVHAEKKAYNEQLQAWVGKERKAVDLINAVSKLMYDKQVELVLFRNPLLDKSVSEILRLHDHARKMINKPINVYDSAELAVLLLDLDLAPAKIDIGKLAYEWSIEKTLYTGQPEFIRSKLGYILDADKNPFEPRDVVLYGFGRIGRIAARELVKQAGKGQQLRLRAIVVRKDTDQELVKRAALLRNDSVHGPLDGTVDVDLANKELIINGQRVQIIAANNPEDVDYEMHGITNALVIDNTGVFSDKDALSRHLKAKGVSRVLLTAPGKEMPNIVYAVNQETLDLEQHRIVSAASCTTNAIVPILKVINDKFVVERGHIETVHAYTNDQNLLDNFHKKPRRGRSAAVNMVITSTGAGKAVAKVLPELEGKLTANAVRVPTPNGSLAILSLTVKKETSLDEVIGTLKDAAFEGNLVNQIYFSMDDELVSSDIIGNTCCAVFDAPATIVHSDKKNIVLYVWYDNEFGYTKQVIRLAKYISKVRRLHYY